MQGNLCNFWKSKNGKLLVRFHGIWSAFLIAWQCDFVFQFRKKNLFEKACNVQQQSFGQWFSFVCTWRILETLELVSWSNIGIAFQGLTNRLGIQIWFIVSWNYEDTFFIYIYNLNRKTISVLFPFKFIKPTTDNFKFSMDIIHLEIQIHVVR